MQLIAGRTGQDYNRRKNRRGAFWEDRYHATAISSDKHLIECMLYIDLNMVRAGVVKQVKEWKSCGYHEIHHTTSRKKVIDLCSLTQVLNMNSVDEFKTQYKYWLEDYLSKVGFSYDGKWSQSIAVGNQVFIDEVVRKLGIKVKYRAKETKDDTFVLREPYGHYNTHFSIKKGHLRLENTHLWNLTV
jgi:hypothetical protein